MTPRFTVVTGFVTFTMRLVSAVPTRVGVLMLIEFVIEPAAVGNAVTVICQLSPMPRGLSVKVARLLETTSDDIEFVMTLVVLVICTDAGRLSVTTNSKSGWSVELVMLMVNVTGLLTCNELAELVTV